MILLFIQHQCLEETLHQFAGETSEMSKYGSADNVRESHYRSRKVTPEITLSGEERWGNSRLRVPVIRVQ